MTRYAYMQDPGSMTRFLSRLVCAGNAHTYLLGRPRRLHTKSSQADICDVRILHILKQHQTHALMLTAFPTSRLNRPHDYQTFSSNPSTTGTVQLADFPPKKEMEMYAVTPHVCTKS